MNIRTRLSLIFFSIVILVLALAAVAIYYFAETNREVEFNRRLKNRALNTARVVTEVKELNVDLQRRLEEDDPASLPDQYIVMIDSLGREVYRSTGPDQLPIDPTLTRKIRQQKELYFNNNRRDVVGFVYSTPTGDYTVLATAWDQFGNKSIATLRTILLFIFLVGVLFVSGISWFYAGRVLNPISRIITEVSTITEGNLSRRLEEGRGRDELAQLARTFNDMLSRLQTSFISQKSFIANASHEIKTPITIMSGEIEVALLQDRERDYYTRILRSVLTGLRRLNTLSTQLLLLAESANPNSQRRLARYRLDDILWEIKEWIHRAYPSYEVEIHFDLDVNPEAFSLMGDEPLMRAAILNLIDNGCKYSPDHRVSVVVNTKFPNLITLLFINAGTIDHREIRNIFNPFYRTMSSHQERGFGVGLSLAQNVVRLHKGSLYVSSAEGVTQFTLQLPTDMDQNSGTPLQPPPNAL